MKQSPAQQPTSESTPQSTPEPQPTPQPTAESNQPTIKSFADFLKSPNRVGITILGILFAIITGLIIAIVIISNSNINQTPSNDTPPAEEQQLSRFEIYMVANEIENINERFEYFVDLEESTNTESYKNTIRFSCSYIMRSAQAYEQALLCLQNIEEQQLTNEEKIDYYSEIASIYSSIGNNELAKEY